MPSLNRVKMMKASRAMIRALDPEGLHVAEISGKWGQQFGFGRYERFHFPKHDICLGPFLDDAGRPRQFDLILANQVWEHLDRPYAATRHVREMLRPGGHFWLAVPFFVPFHAAPVDCSRWTARGLKNLLIKAGFDENARGNRAAAIRNLEPGWPPAYDRKSDSLRNEPDMPICAWALARKT